MDKASYHNVVAQENKVPTSTSTKDQIMIWLAKENIPFNNTYLKPELCCLLNKPKKTKVYQIDKTIAEQGHTCLRLPPYHSHLNPIELVWARVKEQVAAQNTTFKMSDVKNLTHDALSKIDIEY